MIRETHMMQRAGTDTFGAEEWFCPTCGRRFMLQHTPTVKKVVLEPGDEAALHSGSHGGLQVGPPLLVDATATDQDHVTHELDVADDSVAHSEADVPELLRPWFRAMRSSDGANLEDLE